MRDGWTRVALGDVFSRANERAGVYQDEPEVFSITKREGVVPALEYFENRVASADLSKYKWLRDEMWAYSTIHIDEGSIARNMLSRDGVVSPMYTLMNWTRRDHDPGYFELLLRAPQMLARYRDAAQGSLDRRRSLRWESFASMEVEVPPIKAQRWIAHVVARVDAAIHAADGQTAAALQLQNNLRESVFLPGNSWVDARIGDRLDRVSRPVTVDLSAEYSEIGLRSHGRGAFLKQPVTGTSLGKKRVFEVQPGDLCFNIVFAWEGAVAVLGHEVAGRVASHRFPTFKGTDDWEVTWFSEFFMTRRGRQLLVDHSPGGAGRNKTLAISKLLDETIPMPAEGEARKAIAVLSEASAHRLSAHENSQALRALSGNLQNVLLSGEHTIPESYNRLMVRVA